MPVVAPKGKMSSGNIAISKTEFNHAVRCKTADLISVVCINLACVAV